MNKGRAADKRSRNESDDNLKTRCDYSVESKSSSEQYQVSVSNLHSSDQKLPACVNDRCTITRSRLLEFVQYFVEEMEAKLTSYHLFREGKIKKAGKFSDNLSEKIGEGIGGALGGTVGLLVGSPSTVAGIGSKAGGKIAKGISSYIKDKNNMQTVNNLVCLIDRFQKDKKNLREVFVGAGFDIFQSFEMQFVSVTCDDNAPKAMQMLAKDAMNRAISYVNKNFNKSFDELSMSEGVLLGTSKIEPFLDEVPVPFSKLKKPGFDIYFETNCWNTANLFTKSGVVITESSTYHNMKDGKCKPSKYGYRRLLMQENWKEVKEKYYCDKESVKNKKFRDYNYILDPKTSELEINSLLDIINKKDKALGEDRIKKALCEAKDEILKAIDILKEQTHHYPSDRALLLSIEKNFKQFNSEDYFESFREYFTEAKKERQEMTHLMKDKFEDASHQRQEIHEQIEMSLKKLKNELPDLIAEKTAETVISRVSKAVKSGPIWFGVRNIVTAFTALSPERLDNLQEIADNVHSKIVVITGLDGVGKTELAIKHARDDHDENSVIWINAKSRDSLKNSFHRLCKDHLNIQIRDSDGEEKSLEFLVGNVYEFFADRSSLFIFDNAENSLLIQEFLPIYLPPQSRKPYILITSSTSDWRIRTRDVAVVHLGDFGNLEAIEFVKKALNISDDSKNEDIESLVQKLHRFPLALHQAVEYIVHKNEELSVRGSEFQINEYLKKFEQTPRKLLSVKLPPDIHSETIFQILEVTFDKIISDEIYGVLALNMMNIISYFASNDIPEKIFLDELADGNEKNLFRITGVLKKYSIVTLERGMLNMHGLIQQVIRLELRENRKGEQCEEAILEKALTILRKCMVDRNSISCFAQHILSVWDHASKYDSLIETFIVRVRGSSPTYSTYFHVISESYNYKVVHAVLNMIEQKYPGNAKKLLNIINAKNNDDERPLHCATRSGNDQIVALLLQKGAEVNVKKKYGWTPLHLASKYGYLKIVTELLNKCASTDTQKTAHRFTPLHLAAQNGHAHIVRILIEKGLAEVNAETTYKFTPLHFASEHGYLDIVEYLLSRKATLNARTNFALTPLHFAARNGHTDVASVLLKHSALVNVLDSGKFTPLHIAAQTGNVELMSILLNCHDIEVNAQTSKENSPLHLAAENDHLKAVQLLIAKNALTSLENKEGKKAIDLGMSQEVKDYIRKQVFNRLPGTSGLDGQLYEINLLILFLLQGFSKTAGFHLATNVREAGVFDDVVFKYKDKEGNGRTKKIFLQAKHRQASQNEKKISMEQLFSAAETGDFNLKKYFNAYCSIKQEFLQLERNVDTIFGEEFEDLEFVIYTNAVSTFSKDKGSIEKVMVEKNSIFNFFDGAKFENNFYYKLNLNAKIFKKIDVLQYGLDCKKLAKELDKSVFLSKTIDFDNNVLRNYHLPLAEKVFEKETKREGKFKKSFLKGEGDAEFRNIFYTEIRKRLGKVSDEDLTSELEKITIQLPENFGEMTVKKGKYPESLPNQFASDDEINQEIEQFISRLKLFVEQPSESDLSKIIKQKIQVLFDVEQQDIDWVFSNIEHKVRKWWQTGDKYLTEKNRLFQDSIRTSIKFDIDEPTSLFTGRVSQLEDIHRILQDSGKVSVHGLGGVGKSELAKKYISEHSKDYDNNCIWINTSTYHTIEESFRRVAKEKLKIKTTDAEGNERDIQCIIPEVYNFFGEIHRKSLFVFDNAEKYKTFEERDEGIDKFLPLNSNHKTFILITSRHREWGEIKSVPLDVFTENEAVEYIQKALSMEISLEADMKDLAKELQYLPLALTQAVSYIRIEQKRSDFYNETFTIANYLAVYREKAEELLSLPLDQEYGRYANTVFTTWTVSKNKIESEEVCGGEALQILNVIAYLASDRIPVREICSKVIRNEKVLRRAVSLLYEYSFARQGSGTLSIHRLLQQVTRIYLKKESKEKEIISKTFGALRESFPKGKDTIDDYSMKRKLLPHFEAFLFNVDEWAKTNLEEKSKIEETYHEDLMLWMSEGYFDIGNPRRQKELLEKVLPIVKRHHGENHFQVSLTLGSLGNAYGTLGDHLKQKELLEQTLVIKETWSDDVFHEDKNFQIALTLSNLSNAYGDLELYQKQKDLLERALATFESHDSESLEVASVLTNLGVTCGDLGNYQEQKGHLERALLIFERKYGRRSMQVADVLVNLGIAYGDMGNNEEKKKLIEEALPIFESNYGSDNFQVAIPLLNLGNAYGALGNYEMKIELAERAAELKAKHYGPNHFQVAKALFVSADAYGKLGNYEKQKDLLEQVVFAYEVKYKRNSLKLADARVHLGLAYGDLGDHQHQMKLLTLALPVLEKYDRLAHFKDDSNVVSAHKTDHSSAQKPRKPISGFEIKKLMVGIQLELVGNAYWILKGYRMAYELFERSSKITNQTLLHVALWNGNLGMVKKFIDQGANVFARNEHDYVLHQVIAHGDEDLLKFVLNRIEREDSQRMTEHINVQDLEGDTPLMWAAEKGKVTLAKILLDYGACVSTENNNGETALNIAAKCNHWEVSILLLRKKRKHERTPTKQKLSLNVCE